MSELDAQFVTFDLAGQTYGIRVTAVEEVIRMVGMSTAPEALPFVVGLVNIRGHIVPVVDMRTRLHLERGEYSLATPILITKSEDSSIGLIVDRVREVITLTESAIERPNNMVSKSRCLIGVAKINSKMVFLIDLQEIFSADEAELIEELSAAQSIGAEALA